MSDKISKSTQDLYLANTLGLTDRAIRSMKKNNPDRYKREVLGSLLLSTGTPFEELFSSLLSLNMPLVIDNNIKSYLDKTSQAFSIIEGRDKAEYLVPTKNALFLLRTFMINLYKLHTDGDKYLEIDVIRYIDGPPVLEVSSRDIYQRKDSNYKKLTVPLHSTKGADDFLTYEEIILGIDEFFPNFKKDTPTYFPFKVTTLVTFFEEKEILERIKENKDTSVLHYLKSVDITANGIKVRRTETMNGVLNWILEITIPESPKSFRFDFTEEEFIKHGREINSSETIEIIESQLPSMFSYASISDKNQTNILRSLENLKEINNELQLFIKQENAEEIEYLGEVFITYQSNFNTLLLDSISPGLASAISTQIDDVKYWIPKIREEDAFILTEGVRELLGTTIEREFSTRCAISKSPRGQIQLLEEGNINE